MNRHAQSPPRATCPSPASPASSAFCALVVEDDPSARKYIRLALGKSGFQVVEAGSGEEALEAVAQGRPHVALVDLGLPGMDGFELCRRLRSIREDLAILILTGRAEDADKVSGLDLGADDYLVKPIAADVLLARIRAVLRRCGRTTAVPAEVLTLADLRVECLTMKVFKAGHEVDLTPREFILLTTFLRHPGEVLTRDRLRREVWGDHHFGSTKALDVFVCKLREKLEEDPAHPRMLRTEWGVGYVCS